MTEILTRPSDVLRRMQSMIVCLFLKSFHAILHNPHGLIQYLIQDVILSDEIVQNIVIQHVKSTLRKNSLYQMKLIKSQVKHILVPSC